MELFDMVRRAWQGLPLTPAERSLYRGLKMFGLGLLSSMMITAGQIASQRNFDPRFLLLEVAATASTSIFAALAKLAAANAETAPLSPAILNLGSSVNDQVHAEEQRLGVAPAPSDPRIVGATDPDGAPTAPEDVQPGV